MAVTDYLSPFAMGIIEPGFMLFYAMKGLIANRCDLQLF